MIGIWCNGSTEDFGSSSTSSNLVIPAISIYHQYYDSCDDERLLISTTDIDNKIILILVNGI